MFLGLIIERRGIADLSRRPCRRGVSLFDAMLGRRLPYRAMGRLNDGRYISFPFQLIPIQNFMIQKFQINFNTVN